MRVKTHEVTHTQPWAQCWVHCKCSDGTESACNARDPGSISGSGRCPGEGNGNPPQYFCLENSMDGGAWQATVHGVIESDTTEQLTLLLHFMTSIQET